MRIYCYTNGTINTDITGCSRKTAQSFMHDKFRTVCRKMITFAPEYSAEITHYHQRKICVNELNILC